MSTIVPITETASDPRQPSRFEKKANTRAFRDPHRFQRSFSYSPAAMGKAAMRETIPR
jgi:hypothetical protein